jgi:hypothetical protein
MDSDQKDSISGVGFGEQDDPSDLDSVWAGLALDTLDGGWGGGLPLASPASIAADFLPTPHSALADLEAFRGTEIVSPLPDDHATVFLAAVPPPPAQEVREADSSIAPLTPRHESICVLRAMNSPHQARLRCSLCPQVLAADVSDPRARGETAGGLAPMPMQSPSPPPQVSSEPAPSGAREPTRLSPSLPSPRSPRAASATPRSASG